MTARPGPFLALSRVLRCTHGQAYTLVLALLLAVVFVRGVGDPAPLAGQEIAAPVTTTPETLPPVVVVPPPVVPGSDVPTLPGIPLPSAPVLTPSPLPPDPVPPVAVPGTPGVVARVGEPWAPGALAMVGGALYAGTDNGTARGGVGPSRLFRYDGKARQSAALVLTGQSQHARGISGLVALPDGRLAVADAGTGRVLTVDRSLRTQRVWGVIPDLPACLLPLLFDPCEPGLQNHPPLPAGMVVDAKGDLYVADAGQATIWRLTKGSTTAQVWFQSVTWSGGPGPTGLAWSSGGLDVTVGVSIEATNPNGGGLYHLALGPGAAAPTTATLRAPFAPGELPGPLAVGRSGTAYVVLLGTGKVVTVSSTGTVTPLATGAESPTALALDEGRLLVASGVASGTPERCDVTAVRVADAPQGPA